MTTVLIVDRRYFSRRIVREIQKACDRASAYLIARDEVVRGCPACKFLGCVLFVVYPRVFQSTNKRRFTLRV